MGIKGTGIGGIGVPEHIMVEVDNRTDPGRKVGCIRVEMEQLEKAIHALGEQIEKLEDKLDPVLAQEPGPTTPKDEPELPAPMANAIQRYRQQIDELFARVHDINGRVEL